MKAVLINEALGDILRPKHEQDIFKEAMGLSQEEKNEKFFRAVQNVQTKKIKLFLQAGADPNYESDGDYAIIRSAACGALEIVKILINAGANVNSADSEGDRAILEAAYFGYYDIVELLLKAGAKNYKDIKGNDAIYWANKGGHEDIIKLLKKYK
jgi:ankyrin repeat protein